MQTTPEVVVAAALSVSSERWWKEAKRERGTWTRRDAFGAEGATHVASLTRPFNMFLLRGMYGKGLEGMYVLLNVRADVCWGREKCVRAAADMCLNWRDMCLNDGAGCF